MNRGRSFRIFALFLLAFIAPEFAEGQQPNNITPAPGYSAVSGADDISNAVNQFIVARRSRPANDSTKDDLERIKYLLAELSGQEEQLAGLLRLGLRQAQQSGADRITYDALAGRVSMCWQTFDQLRAVFAPITSMPGVETRLIGGLHSFMADSVLFARDQSGHTIFTVGRGNDYGLQVALGYADGIEHESEQIMVLANNVARQIDSMAKP